jgi:DUF1365 family protein
MVIEPQIFHAKVMHKRLFPKVNSFVYRIYYLMLPLNNIQNSGLAVNRFAPISFHQQDHGAKQKNKDLSLWINDILKEYGLKDVTNHVILVAMPRILGYVFNPVSFWLCLCTDNKIRAVLCEVNNTFGETHSYLCARPDHAPIDHKEWLESQKLFHVSPFLEREGHYKFRFQLEDNTLGIWIDFYDAENRKKLITSLVGNLKPMNARSLRMAFWAYPLVTFKSITLIHWHAMKLIAKDIRHIKKPEQKAIKLSATENLTKM